jgi:hypothetical protein
MDRQTRLTSSRCSQFCERTSELLSCTRCLMWMGNSVFLSARTVPSHVLELGALNASKFGPKRSNKKLVKLGRPHENVDNS